MAAQWNAKGRWQRQEKGRRHRLPHTCELLGVLHVGVLGVLWVAKRGGWVLPEGVLRVVGHLEERKKAVAEREEGRGKGRGGVSKVSLGRNAAGRRGWAGGAQARPARRPGRRPG